MGATYEVQPMASCTYGAQCGEITNSFLREIMKQISTAFVKAQKDFGPALKSSTNPHFKSKYADLAACVEAVMDGLNDNGIAMIQTCHECVDGVLVETTFIHESGETINCGKLHVPAQKKDAQGYGSALTYARRYSLMAACGIAPEDDDANAASKKGDVKNGGSLQHSPRDLPEFSQLDKETTDYLCDLARWVVDTVANGAVQAAKERILADKLDDTQRTYLENQMDSKTRSALKK